MVATLTVTEIELGRRLVGAASIVVIAVVYVVWGRSLLTRDDVRAGTVVVGVVLLVFAVGTYEASVVSYLLFAVCPLIFLLLPLRPAAPLVVVACLVPVLCAVARDGWSTEILTHLGSIFLVSAALAVWLGTWINRVIAQSRERGVLIAELRASRAEVVRLSHEAGVAAERARLAGEIHDTLAQGFTSIITLVQAADPALANERLALAVRTARENLAESRALIAALGPSALADASLAEAVRRQASSFSETTGIPATARVTGEPRALPTAIEVVLLRAAQEALTNVRRHAGAREADLLLAYRDESVRLVVRDDGRGFDPDGARGFGLTAMRARAEQVRGSLLVRSDPETGTTIELEVPA
ncbi:sensor histidine kinase [Actinoplanes sp. NPDC051470]|uniref:sensor histidine kinase n=1 Tax=Actinoplanes sp. NPDC051470 TaxID=3157224 RepID=UPI00343A58D5